MGKPVNELKWYYEAYEDSDPGMPQHAIVDEEGFVIVGMAHMTQPVAHEIVQNHNEKLENNS